MRTNREIAETIWINLTTDFNSSNVERHNKFIEAITQVLESRDKRIAALREALKFYKDDGGRVYGYVARLALITDDKTTELEKK
jgi:DNA polymerase IIIc chi subunit